MSTPRALALVTDDAVSMAETVRLTELEAVIADGLPTFARVGAALLEIRDDRLYRGSHDTFEAYCRERWGVGRNYVNKTIAAAEVVRLVGTDVPIPTSEAVARELVPLRHRRRGSHRRLRPRVRVRAACGGRATVKALVLALALSALPLQAESRMTPDVFAARAWLQHQVRPGNWRCLHRLWANESGWRVRAGHPSRAYGLPQASPGWKMRRAGRDWRTSAMTQSRWGLAYIRGRYGTPCHALAAQNRLGWY